MRILRLKDLLVPSMTGSGSHSEETRKIQVVPRLLGLPISGGAPKNEPAGKAVGFGLGFAAGILKDVFEKKTDRGGKDNPPLSPPPDQDTTTTSTATTRTTSNTATPESSTPKPSASIITSTSPNRITTATSASTTVTTTSSSGTTVATVTSSSSTARQSSTTSPPVSTTSGVQPSPASPLSSTPPSSTISTPLPSVLGSARASLSSSAIAGIVVGVVIGVLVLIFLVLFCIRRRRAINTEGLSFEKAHSYPFIGPNAAIGARNIGRPPSPESIRAFDPSLMVGPGRRSTSRSSSSLRSIGRILLATRRDPRGLATPPQESPPSQAGLGSRSRWSTTDLSLSSATSVSEESGTTMKPLPNPFADSANVSSESYDGSSDSGHSRTTVNHGA